MATKIRNTSAAIADRLSESIDQASAPASRKELAAERARIFAEETAREKKLVAERESSESNYLHHEYTQLVTARNRAKFALNGWNFAPYLQTKAAEQKLIDSLTVDEQRAIQDLKDDVQAEQSVYRRGTYRNDSEPGLAESAAATARHAWINEAFLEADKCKLADDVFAAVATVRKTYGISKTPRAEAAAEGWSA